MRTDRKETANTAVPAKVAKPRRGLLQRLWRNERGSLYVVGALIAMPLIGLVGVGADTAKVYLAKLKFEQALDAAALAAAKSGDPKTYDAVMQKYFKLNFPDGYMGASVSGLKLTADKDGNITLSGQLKMPTDFMHLFGFDSLNVGHEVEVKRETARLDIVISMDMSGSMGSYVNGKRKIDAARESAKTLVDVLFGENTINPMLKIGLVPWNGNVNVKIDGKVWDGKSTKKFLSSTFKNPLTGDSQNFVWTTTASPVHFLNQPNNSWKGCVYARYRKDSYTNNDADAILGNLKHVTGDWVAYEARNDDEIGSSSYTRCLKHGITPMTTSRSAIKSAINALQRPTGHTDLPQGLVWAWRALSPKAPFSQGTPDGGKEKLIRSVVLLSDGANCARTGDGYKAAWGGCSSYANGEMDKRLKLVAANMKKAGIVIYTIQFGNNSSSLAALLKQVASSNISPHYHYAPDAAALQKAFKEVANSLSDLRISK